MTKMPEKKWSETAIAAVTSKAIPKFNSKTVDMETLNKTLLVNV